MNKDDKDNDVELLINISSDARLIIGAVGMGIIVNLFTVGPILNTLDLGTILTIAIISRRIMKKIDNIKNQFLR